MTGFESVVGINPWTALFTFCNLIITYLVLKKLLFKPVKKMIDDRQKEIDGIYADAETARLDAKNAQSQYAEKLREANQEASAIVSQAAQTAREKGDGILQEARQEAAALKEKAAADIALERKKAVNQLKDELSGMAIAIAAKVAEKEITAEDHDKMVQDFINGLGEQV